MSVSPSFSLFIGAALLVSSAPAQSTPPPPAAAHRHAPAPSTHAHGPLTLDPFVTSATPFARNQAELAQSTTLLSGRSLMLKQQPTLGETLAGEAGVNATSFGPGASRPIIRGLSGDRIRLLENGIGTFDASVISPDHAVSVEPLVVERIEVVRGPASLLYGGNAVGGVVNVITHRIETDLPTERVRGKVEVRGSTAERELAGGGVIDVAVPTGEKQAVIVHVDAFRRRAQDIGIPGFAESARIRNVESAEAAASGDAEPDFAAGRLPNSARRSASAAAGVSFVASTYHFGVSHSGLDQRYGVPGHAHAADEPAHAGDAAGVQVDLRQRRTDFEAEWHRDGSFIQGLRLKLGAARYRHHEIEPNGEVGTTFENRGHEGRLELTHGGTDGWSGAIGLHTTEADFAAAGEEAFLPPSLTRSAAVFVFEEVTHGATTWQAGARLERMSLHPDAGTVTTSRDLSASLGVVRSLQQGFAFAASIAQTRRAPNAQQRFADGPHAGTQAYERGQPGLKSEKSLGLEASLRRPIGAVTGALTVFLNRFDGYIFEQPTGEIARETAEGWVISSPDGDAGIDGAGELPVYRTVQTDARFWGAELEAVWHLAGRANWHVDLRLAGDFTRATEGGRPLPRIPASRLMTGVTWQHGPISAGVDLQHVFSQSRVAANESASRPYRVLSAHVAREFAWRSLTGEIFLRGTNLLDEEIRPHTSFVKELAPLSGRGAATGIRFTF